MSNRYRLSELYDQRRRIIEEFQRGPSNYNPSAGDEGRYNRALRDIDNEIETLEREVEFEEEEERRRPQPEWRGTTEPDKPNPVWEAIVGIIFLAVLCKICELIGFIRIG